MNETMESGYFKREAADLKALEKDFAANPTVTRTLIDALLPFLLLVVPLAFILSAMAVRETLLDYRFCIGGFLGSMIQLVVYHRVVLWMLRRRIKKFSSNQHTQWRDNPMRVRIGPEGLIDESQCSTTLYRWSVVWRVGESPERAFFYLDAQTAIVVPMRAFVSEQAYEDFVELAFLYRKQARQEPPETGITLPPAPNPSTDITRDVDHRNLT